MQPSPEEMKARIRATFNAASDHFDDPPLAFWDHFGSRTVELAGIGPGDRVLDVCCGTGASALPAAEVVGSSGAVIGVDFAEKLLDLGRDKAKRQGLDWLSFQQGDLTNLDLPPDSFEAVICVFGIFFVPDMAGALAGLWRLVKPGGKLAITVWGPRVLEPGSTAFWEAVDAERPDLRPKVVPWERLIRPEGLARLFTEAGLPSPEIVPETLSTRLGPDDFWVVVLGSGCRGIVNQLEPEAAERLRAGMAERLDGATDGELFSDVLYAVAEKPEAQGV
jgi:SAM-dependent methyltransferase